MPSGWMRINVSSAGDVSLFVKKCKGLVSSRVGSVSWCVWGERIGQEKGKGGSRASAKALIVMLTDAYYNTATIYGAIPINN